MSSSKRWLQEHFSDPYVKRAKTEGYLSRAAYKLRETHEKYGLFRPKMLVVDLGAAPGGWSQVVKEYIGEKGHLIAVDILPMTVSGVDFIRGDFNDPLILQQLLSAIAVYSKTGLVDLVISDLAPNMSGQRIIDQPRSQHLVELAWDCAQQILKPGANFLVKVFQGAGTQEWVRELRQHFKQVKIHKPNASRARSSEVYVLGMEFLEK